MNSRGGSGAKEEEEWLSQKRGLVVTEWWAGREGGRESRYLSISLLQRPGDEMGNRSGPGALRGEVEWAGAAGNTPVGEETHSTVAWRGPSCDKGALRPGKVGSFARITQWQVAELNPGPGP